MSATKAVPRAPWWCVVALVVATLAAYANSFSGALVYDDVLTIIDNPSIRRLWPITEALTPPRESGLPVAGRPLVNLSLAINYALGGTSVRGYHAVNLAIHAGAGLLLFGCVRRTFARAGLRERFGAASTWIAFTATLGWLVHPLQTSAVTYIVQRAESLMALFFLLTLYAVIRAIESPARRGWQVVAVLACLGGMATKEVMVSAPLIALLYDRTFANGSFAAAWRMRRGLYAGLAGTWLLLIYLVSTAGSRGGTAGFESPVSAWDYLVTQARAIAEYARLVFWPEPLVFDHGVSVAALSEVWPQAVVIVALFALTLIAVARRMPIGFAGFWFFAVLAPSSSVVPVATETMAEHRMYLALAAVMPVLAAGAYRIWGRRGIALGLGVALPLLGLTVQRNLDYRSETAIWADTVAKKPENARAQFNLGTLLAREGRQAEAVRAYRAAVAIKPNFASAHSNLADLLFQRGDFAGSREHAERAVQLNPRLAAAQANLGNLAFREKRFEQARASYERAVALEPNNPDVRDNLGTALSALGRLSEAAAQYELAAKAQPESARIRFHLGNTLARLGRLADAAAQYEAALRLQPDYAAARDNLQRVRALEAGRAGALQR